MSNRSIDERMSIKVCVKFLLELQSGAVSMTRKQITEQAVEKHQHLSIPKNLT